ncbi:hypothetical protein ZIOFF_046750 [Zingiber officinale]|uniref:Uncharacterized protein n=1 Tax=Zingiber officinale TaxID=94328 RepID=A0A8J5FTU8_ZINOF|nr:hypothetical protein ZIOFF_046750 [Zingiber officinale]
MHRREKSEARTKKSARRNQREEIGRNRRAEIGRNRQGKKYWLIFWELGIKVTSSDKVNSEERLRYKLAGGSKDCADDRKLLFLGVHHRERLPISSPDVPLWLRRPGVKGNGLVLPWCSLVGRRACFDRVQPTADSSGDQQILEASGDISADGAEGTLDSVAQSCHLRSCWVSLYLGRGVAIPMSSLVRHCIIQRPYGFSFRSGIGPNMTDNDICAIGC